jgi:hypothetical protein
LAAQALLQCIREFALDVKELDAPAFKAGLGELAERLAAEKKLSRVEALFELRKSGISTFAQRQKDYLRERETGPARCRENFAGSLSCPAGVRVTGAFSAQFLAGCSRGPGGVHGSCFVT